LADVTATARRAIQQAYLRGDTLEQIAAAAGVSVREADIYLNWWCDRGCPDEQEVTP
jgi:DNA-directed RNA polymerase specialized sigma24 family protein